MGCGIGYGYLHRIPVRTIPSLNMPSDTSIPSKTESSSFNESNLQASKPVSSQATTTLSQNIPQQALSNLTNVPTPNSEFLSSPPVSDFLKTSPPVSEYLKSPPVSEFLPPPPVSTYISTFNSSVPQYSGPVFVSTPLPVPKTTPPINPYINTASHTSTHPSYNWMQTPHPATLGGATTIQTNNFASSGNSASTVPGGVIPAVTSSKFHTLLNF